MAATYTQDNTNIGETRTDIHAFSGIRTYVPSVQASEGTSCPRQFKVLNQNISEETEENQGIVARYSYVRSEM
jgi:hypothetical protein